MEEKTKNDYLNEDSKQTKGNKSKLNGGLASLISEWQEQAEKLDPKMDTIKTVNKARDLGRSEAIKTCIMELQELIEKAC